MDKTTLLSVFKILLIINFIFIGSPTATHALIEAGDNSEVEPWKNEKIKIEMILSIEILLMVLVVLLAFISLWIRDLVSAVVVFGAYSFLMCLIWTGMGAVDVAFTEAAVGAGVSTVFFIAVLFNTTRRIKFNPLDITTKLFAGVLCVVFGYLLFLGVSDLPMWGSPESPVNSGMSSYYIEEAYHDTKVPNLVTAVLADYRAFDTMFETCVVFIAMLGIFMLLKKMKMTLLSKKLSKQ